ncbi:MAG: ATP-dependent RNA helicase DbpA [Zetaproteobacteria bacterium CG12_big_fil_rev_8_21_14_0_65_55_1124]|nr:MAG: ATP-dependent RNA helicase DbpA [Zetaproteobacteria bacterium CG1_02_55_237]PIS19357.1 MAG: ATP-dependent RNA helicase DbpA [Zetaproteobacteria bacterium CG08_land_8_20_14_0_20_55_17]PIW43403.1 MAG: ATP-dependent RNA helicase DbpA [Zetaproteobacteria bacterium CG12_big_fil_rev_8_21_14_0_65_55_1124]PIY53598.1 MAG: ATP-dependent RNA helicase DbpA [Zetaproteobacteria bacterium CG_4_10_14_0_8_um_filter_55_43]PIZ37257.1 MAG: ATP-dependent RNA helicase DbpA [Zetaproteobacteria bacterium CG_4_
MNSTAFSSLTLHADLSGNLASLGYEEMTPIQAQSLPDILAGKDVIAQGKTGSGKTAAFGLGLLQKLDVQHLCVQSLVLCPTRELADQVAKEIRRLARGIPNIKILTLCGGVPLGPQIGSLEYGAHIIVGTPGRIEDHLAKGTLTLNSLNTLVLDEADRMLDMGFQPSLDVIVGQMPKKRQTLLFSATFPDAIKAISGRIMRNPVLVQVASTHDSNSIEQRFFRVEDDAGRLTALRLLLLEYSPESTLVFCNTKVETQEVADALVAYGFKALALHGDLEQRDRDQTMVQFANRSISILVATDVAARGLDIDTLDAVINYHIPHDPETYIHRIGRTGRAGCKGMAFSLYQEHPYRMIMLGDSIGRKIESETLPSVSVLNKPVMQPPMATLQIGGGKKQKVRPGDILGALTGENGIAGKQVGKIQIFDNWAYVAISRDVVKVALRKLTEGKLKGRSFRVRQMFSWPD